MSKSVTEYI